MVSGRVGLFGMADVRKLHTVLLMFVFLQNCCSISVYNVSRSISNFLIGYSFLLPDEDMSTVGLCRRLGYSVETHHVTTEDGYVLELHRIPRGRNVSGVEEYGSRYPVIVQHGNFQSSADWLVNSPESESLGFVLADDGYDIWLGNQRGNEYSTRHSREGVFSSAYWNFSFHEMGVYDVPAVVDYVLNVTGKRKAHYIGFSLGTTAFFAGLSKRPEYNDNIGVGIALGPSTFQKHFFNGWVKVVAPVVWAIQLFQKFAGDMPVLPHIIANLLHKFLPIICHPRVDIFGICISFVQIGFGHDHGKISKERLHAVTKISPSSSSMKCFIHQLQLMGTNRFCEYDYGKDGNMMAYGKTYPPDYNLTNVRAPVALLVGRNDVLAHREDAKTLAKKISNLVDFHFIPYEHFTHLDFCYANGVSSLVYSHIISLLRKYDNT